MKILNERSGPKTYSSTHPTWTKFGLVGYKNGQQVNAPSLSRPKFVEKSRFAGIKNPMTKQISIAKAKKKTMMEDLKKSIELLDFTRRSYETFYNHYYNDKYGTPKAHRIRVRGYRFFDEFNNQVARVEVETKNENNIITIFEISPKYQGLRFGKDLLQMAKISLSANAASIEKNEESKIRFFEYNGFIKMGENKQNCILKLLTQNPVDRSKTVELFDKPSVLSAIDREFNNELYHTGGYDYEGYRDYL
jgi:cytochrome c biogenesis protein ResB